MTCGLTSGDRQGNIRNGVPLHIGFESQIGLTAHLRPKIREISHKNSPFDRIGLLDRGDAPGFLDFEVFQGIPEPLPDIRRRRRFAFHRDPFSAPRQHEVDLRTGSDLENGGRRQVAQQVADAGMGLSFDASLHIETVAFNLH